MVFNRKTFTLLSFIVSLILVGCGGGGDDSGGDSTPPPPPATNTAPVASAGADQSIAKSATALLSAFNSVDSDGNTLSYRWSMTSTPSGSTAVLSSNSNLETSFVADLTGTYVVSLVVNDGTIDSQTDTVTIIASNLAPIADAGDDIVAPKGVQMVLDGSASRDPNGDFMTYQWLLTAKPSGSSPALSDEATKTPKFTPDLVGTYQFDLVVRDGVMGSETDSIIIEATNTAPVANAGGDRFINTNITTALDGSGSFDENGDALSYQWAITGQPNGSNATLGANGSMSPEFTADIDGNYVFSLIVFDGEKQSLIDTVTYTASSVFINTAPVASAGDDQSQPRSTLIQLDGSASLDVDGHSLVYRWTFNNKPVGSNAILSDPTASEPTFTADIAGEYLFTLVVNDGQIDSNIDPVTITAIEVAPISHAGTDQAINTGALATLDGRLSFDANNDTLIYQWRFVSKPANSTAVLSGADTVAPTFIVDVDATYVVSLVVSDGLLSSETSIVSVVTSTVINNSVPVANAGQNKRVNTGVQVRLDASQSSDGDGNTLTYRWAIFTKPANSNIILSDTKSVAPTFTPDIDGQYAFTLVVNDSIDDSDMVGVTITASNTAPIADAGDNQTIHTGNLVSLDGSGSQDNEGNTLTYAWIILASPAGSTASLSSSDIYNPTFTPQVNGEYHIGLSVHDGREQSSESRVIITAFDATPIADAGVDQTTTAKIEITLDGTNSSDEESEVLTYHWTVDSQPSGSSVSLSASESDKPTFTPTLLGDYVFALVVNDGRLDSIADTVSVSVINTIPVANAGADFDVNRTTIATLDGSNSFDFNDSSLTYRWIMNSKPEGSTAVLSNNNTVNPTFVVDMLGSYSVSLVVNDGMDDSASNQVIVSGINTKPTASAGNDQTIVIGQSTTFDGSQSTDSNADSLTYLWAIDSDPAYSKAKITNETSPTPSLTPDVPGNYVLSLTVNDGALDSDPDTLTLTVTNSAPVADAGENQSLDINQITNMDGSNSSDAEGHALTYQWSFSSVPQNSTATISNASTAFASFTPDFGGDYLVSLVVNDGFTDSIADIITISVRDTRPTAMAGDDVQITTQYTVALDGSNSSDQNNLDLEYFWSLVSAPTGSTATLSDENIAKPTFRPDTQGSYLISLVVNNGLQNSAVDTMLINVTSWITNSFTRSNFILDNGTGILTDVQSVTQTTLDNTKYMEIKTAGIANYKVTMTQDAIDALNSRPNAATDFPTGSTIAILSQIVEFGESVGFNTDSCSLGYWPPGFSCPTDQQKVLLLPINPKVSTKTCNNTRGIIGLTLNGASIYSWSNGTSYNAQGSWRNIAPKFGVYDLGACSGHALTDGDYHHHSFSSCLQNEIGDNGQSHSPIYGFAADGFPVHGPYFAEGILAQSAWVPRDYADVNSASGCGVADVRSCQLVDQYDLGKGTIAATSGPTTNTNVTSSSGNTFVATTGYYFEDYYHNSSITAKGGEKLDKHNGHNHDNFGYHYHMTVINNNGVLEPVFPYTIGPTFYGELTPEGITGGMSSCQ